MHRTRLHKTITTKFKCLVETIRKLKSTLGGSGEGDRGGDDDKGPQDTGRRRTIRRRQVIPCTSISLGVDNSPTATGTTSAPTSGISGTATPFQQALRTTEVYLPGYLWDALNPTERYASVADLCAHIGDQLPIQVVKLIARDVLRGLQDLHGSGATHNNINPNNILLSPTDLRALISQLRAETQTSLRPSELSIGFPCATPPSVLEIPQRLEYIDRQALNAPEAILGAPYGATSDMWALGCVIFELLTSEALFDPAFQTVELGITPEESHLIQMIEVFGELPLDVIRMGKLSDQWFTRDGALRIETTYYPIALGTVLERHIERRDVAQATAFLDTLLKVRPEDRSRAEDVIDHPWFSD
ncbi:hypothetical protein M413DRAFT_424015 [Hebeloma cylindrosporum]|uniref:non-specific serine/threonine protein kinase n=1 Tax=Hebeloma cylindrosporum TaxID=76867 RepID=A0A0C2XG63_HEBCY|nr:hypothetical protein M413DRAFT_424015 [Hebeloma cylindrosporum h7]